MFLTIAHKIHFPTLWKYCAQPLENPEYFRWVFVLILSVKNLFENFIHNFVHLRMPLGTAFCTQDKNKNSLIVSDAYGSYHHFGRLSTTTTFTINTLFINS